MDISQLVIKVPSVLNAADVSSAWSPSSQTTDGGVSPHTWHVPGLDNYQDAAKSTPCTAAGQNVGASVNLGSDTHDLTKATPDIVLQQDTNGDQTFYVWRCASNDNLASAFGGGAISQPITVIWCGKLGSGLGNNDTSYYFLDGYGTSDRLQFLKYGATTPDKWSVNAGTRLNAAAADDSWHVFLLLANGVSSAIYVDGVTAGAGDAGSNDLDGLTIGTDTYNSNGLVGDLGPGLIYASDLSNADKNQVGEYLAGLIGTTWTEIA